MNNCQELAATAQELGLSHKVLAGVEGAKYIQNVLSNFKPAKVTGHLAISNDSISIPYDKYEVDYPKLMPEESIFIFFEQDYENKDYVFFLENGCQLNRVLENTYRFEYFQSNLEIDYLLAINWYVIEGVGTATSWLENLQ